jgi:hypothetical protein
MSASAAIFGIPVRDYRGRHDFDQQAPITRATRRTMADC